MTLINSITLTLLLFFYQPLSLLQPPSVASAIE